MRPNAYLLFCWLAASVTSVLAQEWTPQRVAGLDYPPIARGTGLEGTVGLTCRLDGQGNVTSAEVRFESKSNRTLQILKDAAIENAKKWRFVRTAHSETHAPEATLKYQFKLMGTTRLTPRQEFTFDYPDTVTIVSEMPCADHVPCTEEDLKRHREKRHSMPIP